MAQTFMELTAANAISRAIKRGDDCIDSWARIALEAAAGWLAENGEPDAADTLRYYLLEDVSQAS